MYGRYFNTRESESANITTRFKDLPKTGAPFNSHDILFPKGGYQVGCAVMTINT